MQSYSSQRQVDWVSLWGTSGHGEYSGTAAHWILRNTCFVRDTQYSHFNLQSTLTSTLSVGFTAMQTLRYYIIEKINHVYGPVQDGSILWLMATQKELSHTPHGTTQW